MTLARLNPPHSTVSFLFPRQVGLAVRHIHLARETTQDDVCMHACWGVLCWDVL